LILYEVKMHPFPWSVVFRFNTLLCYHASCGVCVWFGTIVLAHQRISLHVASLGILL